MEVLPPPPPRRDEEENPWPEWPRVWRTEYGHSEVVLRYGRDPRQFNTVTKEFLDNGSGSVCGLRTVQVEWSKNVDTGRWQMTELSDTENVVECDLVLLAMGFVGPETSLITQLRLAMEQSESRIKTQEPSSYATSVPRVFAAGDCRRGQSLVVHAINEGRQAAREVDLYLMGSTALPGQGGHVKAKDGRLC
ncbi:putative glutamate synthase [NADPH] [Fasciola gigantica]|uniref:Putative glutamate synthase [NADPH] n=1 Tax=Fasciola gigantica TaxID=46835 RepID=A0A504Y8S2_FASGI|nr:putative glutamate synthase [NADPH] [Fasciola gigantica]